ncbi:hypothetical protein TPHA_0H00140 [Tetrapisispora phaffii CBS 4417]|uniref:CCHC-type domain-containing protein n=1 Tax=Tetrapisispora phaffii (strain ATCC 24235 / CBS 4417 / NBRC 1672 / NRRL Y-8282 / UCD 70-5) TaxID=1071381 RepID=G8BWS1_TETPH|nr:hypothetical protein TPHA_0H00140 [Tetrapisispora phaffii CBS 4417]CCE64225.1 hypothetical protein TPHA_0H00140 [Tetrapisispora phaffii CBS 4417]
MANTLKNDDIVKFSYAMDQIAKLIAQNKKQSSVANSEYEKKMKELDKLINLLLGLSKSTSSKGYSLNTSKLDEILKEGFEVVTKGNDEKYIMLPIQEEPQGPLEDIKKGEVHIKKSKNKKKNKIRCSYCNETGHTRAKCEMKLMTPIREHYNQ